jgi:hypothetical protein
LLARSIRAVGGGLVIEPARVAQARSQRERAGRARAACRSPKQLSERPLGGVGIICGERVAEEIERRGDSFGSTA